MIYLGFLLRNPFCHRHQIIRDWVFKLSKNQTIEIAVYKNNTLIGGSLSVTSYNQDHRGFSFDIELLGYQLEFLLYDNRHKEEY
jgi:hypothetical protein